jgi:tRNA (cmo5U34)-methyltransferase
MAEHRVLAHLGLAASDYDAVIRKYIGGYERLLAEVVSLVDGDVIDLGAGTGALSAAVLAGKPTTRVKLVDIDPAMLEVARDRLTAFGDRVTVANTTFMEGLSACDAVVASLSLHHVADLGEKRALYRRVYEVLRPGGVLAVADITLHDNGPVRMRMVDAWAAAMAEHGIDRAEADALFAKWATEDRYYSLAQELTLLREAGFVAPECFWKQGPSTVFGAYR